MQDAADSGVDASVRYLRANAKTNDALMKKGFGYDTTGIMTLVKLRGGTEWRSVPFENLEYVRKDPSCAGSGYVQIMGNGFLVTEKSRSGTVTDNPRGYYVGRATIDRFRLELPPLPGVGRCTLQSDEITGLGEWLMINPLLSVFKEPSWYPGTIFIPEHAIEDAEQMGPVSELRFKKPKPL